jgi:hypothetical protein
MASIVKNLKLLKVVDKGVKTKEHLIIAVEKNCNLKDYMVYDNSFKPQILDITPVMQSKHIDFFKFCKQNKLK